MTDSELLQELRALHEKNRTSRLHPGDLARYRAAVDRFLASVLEGQNAAVRSGHKPRAAVRVPRTVAVELSWAGGSARSVTLDLGMGGFSAVLGEPPPADQPLSVGLRIRRGDRIQCGVRVASVRHRRGSARVSFAFAELSETDALRLKMYVVDELLPMARPAADAVQAVAAAAAAAAGDLASRVIRRVA